MAICFDSQGDCVEIAGEMVLVLIELKVNYECEDMYNVVDVNDYDKWVATTPFRKLPWIQMTTNREMSIARNIP